MSSFLYRARDIQGLLVTGQMDGADPEEVRSHLSERGLIPLAVREMTRDLGLESLKKIFQKKVKEEEIMIFTRQFHTLFKAGMSMENVLDTLIRQTKNKRLKEALQQIRISVSSGGSLSKSFSNHEEIFGEIYVSMLAAGEEAGILEGVLKHLGGLLEKEMQTKNSVKSATLYPKIVMFVLFVATLVIMTVVVPQFESFFKYYKAELPLPTRIMMGVSNFLRHSWYLVILGVGGIVWGLRRFGRTSRGKIKMGELQFRVPVFGSLNLKVANARFCHLLSTLYRSGLPLPRCLEVTAGTIKNGAFAREMDILKAEVMQGKMISDAMTHCRYFTPVIIDATAVGEKTGALDEMLEAMGSHYELEVQHTVKNLTTLLEPILLGFIFGVVTVFALAIFLPIWNMSKVVTGH